MEWVETTGKTIEEAKGLALDELGVDESDAEFEVMSDAKTGLFGRVKGEARVRARVRPAVPRSKDSNNRRKRRPEKERAPRGSKSVGGTERSEPSVAQAEEESSGETPRTSKPKPRRRRPAKPAQDEGASNMGDEVALAEQGTIAKEFLSGMFDSLSAPVGIEVDVRDDDEVVVVAVEGENLGHLIGPKGATLQALQELTRTVVQRKTGARNGRIVVDISKYREKRREALERFTRQIIEEVLSSNSDRALEPMNPADRKTVHDVANSVDGVSTTSEGEEPRRRVVIKPSA